ncbi:MAG: AI-2E family transporter [Pirellulales bacterium]|nr:AI-2E family transporter [Pirellulales bacterium]
MGSIAPDDYRGEFTSGGPPSAQRYSQLPKVVLWIALLGLVWRLRYLLLLIFAGVLFGLFLQSISAWVSTRMKVRRSWSLTITVISLTLITAGSMMMFGTHFAQQLSQLIDTMPRSLNTLREQIQHTPLGKLLLDDVPSADEMLGSDRLWAQVGNLATTTVDFMIGSMVIAFIGLYGAVGAAKYYHGVLLLVPRNRRVAAGQILDTLIHNLRWWIIGQLISMSMIGVLAGLGLWLIGLPQAFALGLLAGFFELIPYFGPILSSIPAILIALSQSTTLAIWVGALYLGIHIAEGYVILPLVQRRAASLPPVLTIVAVSLFGSLGGVLGVLVATPLMLTIYLLVQATLVDREREPS